MNKLEENFVDVDEKDVDFWKEKVEENSKKNKFHHGVDFLVNSCGIKYMDAISAAILRIFKNEK